MRVAIIASGKTETAVAQTLAAGLEKAGIEIVRLFPPEPALAPEAETARLAFAVSAALEYDLVHCLGGTSLGALCLQTSTPAIVTVFNKPDQAGIETMIKTVHAVTWIAANGDVAKGVEMFESVTDPSAAGAVEKYLEVYRRVDELRRREDHRPWGFYLVLADEADHKVKRITVYPGKRLSLQLHHRRSEHWHVILGEAVVSLDGKDIHLKAGQSVDIGKGQSHRILNPGSANMAFIEVQRGDYFGEDDIVRLEDDFGRK